MTITKDISDSNVYVKLLPDKYHSEVSDKDPSKLYCVLVNNEVLRTPQGRLIVYSDSRAIRELAGELDYTDELDVGKISLFNLCCTQIDFMDEGTLDWEWVQVDMSLLNDPVLRTCAGPEVVEQSKYLNLIEEYLKQYDIKYPHLPQIFLENHDWFSKEGDANFGKLTDHVYETIRGFNLWQLTAFVTVTHVFDSPVLGIISATQSITPHEFALTYLTSKCINSKTWSDGDRGDERELLQAITRDIECILRYLDKFSPKISKIEKLIQSGESKRLEFKSTLRWNLHTNTKDSKIEHAVLKTIVAFLNTDGGILLVGVEDNGNVLGIQADEFPTEDKFLLHFVNLVIKKIGEQHSNLISWDLLEINHRKVLQVNCKKSPEPIFLKMKAQEEFFIRTGPSSIQLSPSQILDYSKTHYTG